jgi:hypothetical protein
MCVEGRREEGIKVASQLPPRRKHRRPMTDADFADPRPLYSPVCTYCAWWKPEDGYHCTAWPEGSGHEIPDEVWLGANSHMIPFGSESVGSDGKPIVFTLHPMTNKDNLPEKLASDLKMRERS